MISKNKLLIHRVGVLTRRLINIVKEDLDFYSKVKDFELMTINIDFYLKTQGVDENYYNLSVADINKIIKSEDFNTFNNKNVRKIDLISYYLNYILYNEPFYVYKHSGIKLLENKNLVKKEKEEIVKNIHHITILNLLDILGNYHTRDINFKNWLKEKIFILSANTIYCKSFITKDEDYDYFKGIANEGDLIEVTIEKALKVFTEQLEIKC